jgi:hypothetical protein
MTDLRGRCRQMEFQILQEQCHHPMYLLSKCPYQQDRVRYPLCMQVETHCRCGQSSTQYRVQSTVSPGINEGFVDHLIELMNAIRKWRGIMRSYHWSVSTPGTRGLLGKQHPHPRGCLLIRLVRWWIREVYRHRKPLGLSIEWSFLKWGFELDDWSADVAKCGEFGVMKVSHLSCAFNCHPLHFIFTKSHVTALSWTEFFKFVVIAGELLALLGCCRRDMPANLVFRLEKQGFTQ